MKSQRPLYSLLLLLVFGAGCKKERVGMTDEPNKAKIAIMNLVTPNRPSATAANSGIQGYLLYMDGKLLFGQSLLPNKTTGYVLADPGARTIRVDSTEVVANQQVDYSKATVNTTTVQAEAGKYYSIYYGGKVQSPDVLVTTDNLTRPASGKAAVRVVHMSPDAGALDIAGQLTTGTAAVAPVLFSNLAYKTSTAFTEINGGFYRMEVRPNGATTKLSTFTQNNQTLPSFVPGGSAITDFSMNLESGKMYTLVVRGYRDNATATVGQIANPLSVGALINVFW
jgi:hypothetical protein